MNGWLTLATIALVVRAAESGKSDLWDFCGCSFNPWQSWGDCNAECNGRRYRERTIKIYTNKDGCPFDFNTCATSDTAYELSNCNSFCYNGGTSNGHSCHCVTGYYGKCCKLQIDCGNPGKLLNGQIDGQVYTYGKRVTYSCNEDYSLVDGSATRTCQIFGLWSGQTPRCAYYNSCGSRPCKNGGLCKNVPDDFLCNCSNGWSGRICEIDIQPPLMDDCSQDIIVKASDLTKSVDWKIPKFTDPHNFSIQITSNYPGNKYIFPWGDYSVSYIALKPANGLSTECWFQIRIRPHKCEDLYAPVNGALLCTNWKRDYGHLCISLCRESFTVSRGIDPFQWYVCGSSGNWSPSSLVPHCTVNTSSLQSTRGFVLADTYRGCGVDEIKMKMYFHNKLKNSAFSYFCDKFPNECQLNNVEIRC